MVLPHVFQSARDLAQSWPRGINDNGPLAESRGYGRLYYRTQAQQYTTANRQIRRARGSQGSHISLVIVALHNLGTKEICRKSRQGVHPKMATGSK